MKQSSSQKEMSPINIDQSHAVGQDSPTEGSRMGREANKTTDYPGEAESAVTDDASAPVEGESREGAIRRAAHEAYQHRGGAPGSDIEDWLEAEAQVERQRSK